MSHLRCVTSLVLAFISLLSPSLIASAQPTRDQRPLQPEPDDWSNARSPEMYDWLDQSRVSQSLSRNALAELRDQQRAQILIELRQNETIDGLKKELARMSKEQRMPNESRHKPRAGQESMNCTVERILPDERAQDSREAFVDCGGEYSNGTGVISSPTAPMGDAKLYPNNVNCTWVITAPAGMVIRLRFEKLDVEWYPNCLFDRVAVYNGDRIAESNTIGQFCGHTGEQRPSLLTSRSNTMIVNFVTDSSKTFEGFFAIYTQLDVSTLCGGDSTAAAGSIASPVLTLGSLHLYPPNANCTWRLTAPTGRIIRLRFEKFDIQGSVSYYGNSCPSDYVKVYQGEPSSNAGNLLGMFCSRQPSQPILTSNTNKMVVNFVTDAYGSYEGFTATYLHTYTCGGTLTNQSGTFGSLDANGDGQYERNLDCVWNIQTAFRTRIRLWITSFQLQPQSEEQNCTDFLEIRYGVSRDPYFSRSETKPLVGVYCGSVAPFAELNTSSNSLYVRFVSDDNQTGSRGFEAYYNTVECGGVLSDPAGVITSHDLETKATYSHYENCTWIITAPTNMIIRLRFTKLELEGHYWSDGNCGSTSDYVAMYNGDRINSTKTIAQFCGRGRIPPAVMSNANGMLVNFVTDGYGNSGGFSATYTQLHVCGQTFNASSGTFRSLDANADGQYEKELNCLWVITVPLNNIIRLRLNSFALQPRAGNCGDFLEIRDGPYSTSPLVGVYCGLERPFTEFNSTYNALYVRFVSDDLQTNHSGFVATYSVVDVLCGGIIEASQLASTLTSPSYPRAYPANQRCAWVIIAPERDQVQVNVTDIDMASDGENCTTESLEFRDEQQDFDGQSVIMCGAELPADKLVSVNRTAVIVFNSGADNDTSVRRGFSLTYKIAKDCGGELSQGRGSFSSPHYPAIPTTALYCQWTIVVRRATHIVLQLQITSSMRGTVSNCGRNKVEVYDPSNKAGTLTQFCSEGHFMQQPYISSQEKSLRIAFTAFPATPSSPSIAFQASYYT